MREAIENVEHALSRQPKSEKVCTDSEAHKLECSLLDYYDSGGVLAGIAAVNQNLWTYGMIHISIPFNMIAFGVNYACIFRSGVRVRIQAPLVGL